MQTITKTAQPIHLIGAGLLIMGIAVWAACQTALTNIDTAAGKTEAAVKPARADKDEAVKMSTILKETEP